MTTPGQQINEIKEKINGIKSLSVELQQKEKALSEYMQLSADYTTNVQNYISNISKILTELNQTIDNQTIGNLLQSMNRSLSGLDALTKSMRQTNEQLKLLQNN